MDTSQAERKIRAYFQTITESGVEIREMFLEMKDLEKWMEKLDCEELGAHEILTEGLLKGKIENLNIKFPIKTIFLELAES